MVFSRIAEYNPIRASRQWANVNLILLGLYFQVLSSYGYAGTTVFSTLTAEQQAGVIFSIFASIFAVFGLASHAYEFDTNWITTGIVIFSTVCQAIYMTLWTTTDTKTINANKDVYNYAYNLG